MLAGLKGMGLLAACVVLSVMAWKIRRRWREDPAHGRQRVAAILGAVVLGAFCTFVSYPLDQRTKILGFPFPSAIFQLSPSGQWEDFIGITTFILLGVNAAIGSALGYGLGRAWK